MPGALSVTCTAMRSPCHSTRSCSSASLRSSGAGDSVGKAAQEGGAVGVQADVAQRRRLRGQMSSSDGHRASAEWRRG
jgi:hypothetical protein